ncbi:MAG: D-tyrosyl-tRNA(Tyr) deacylase [Spirochaetales bacterium]|jgi:D-tyrosyl-tRNA(Tyr) deacylase|nr:D-tyrosyl-tRNA(Tyr) deacylase [Spirochaetales bacterium]
MRAVVQLVRDCTVYVEGKAEGTCADCRAGSLAGSLEAGLLVYLGVARGDSEADIAYMANKIINLRIFPDENGKMNKSLGETGEGIMVISQFTLYGDVRKGRRPSYDAALPPREAEKLYEAFLERLSALGFPPRRGQFQADMRVSYTNRGPVTILVDSEKKF